jgi:hypothetical protein
VIILQASQLAGQYQAVGALFVALVTVALVGKLMMGFAVTLALIMLTPEDAQNDSTGPGTQQVDVTDRREMEAPAVSAPGRDLGTGGHGSVSTSAGVSVKVRVRPGLFQWRALEPGFPAAGVRVAHGVIGYLHGDGAAWEVWAEAHQTSGATLRPGCTSVSDSANPVRTGAPVLAGQEATRVLLCAGVGGGIWHASLDTDRRVDDRARIEIELLKP